MQALVVYCHPVTESFCAAIRDAAVRGLENAGHEVTVIDLSAEEFNPVMSVEEWHSYRDRSGLITEDIRHHIELVKKSNILVFVYPTWWSTMPAQLKGWLERVMLQDVAFVFNKKNKVRPALTNVKRIFVLSTFGSPRWYVRFIHDNGRRVFSRALRMSTGRTRVTSIALYGMDTQTPESRQVFLQRVTKKLSK